MIMKEHNFDWYSLIQKSDDITQGDIILDCLVPVIGDVFYTELLKTNEGEVVNNEIDIIKLNAIILSQACDITNDKLDSIIICPIWTLKDLMATEKFYQSSDAREKLRQGLQPIYHLLNEYILNEFMFPFSVVDFRDVYTLPKTYLKAIAKTKDTRIRLLPPYREHLSQAFARYFMRVGLPVDISKEAIKNIK